MTEERYSLDMELVPYSIVDLYTGDTYPIDDEGIFETVVNLLNKSHQSKKELEERINRQANTIAEKCAVIDNYIDVKAKLAGKIEEYTVHRKEQVEYLDGGVLYGTNDLLDRLNDYEKENEQFKQLMMKYEIDSIEKLDQVLFNQRVW